MRTATMRDDNIAEAPELEGKPRFRLRGGKLTAFWTDPIRGTCSDSSGFGMEELGKAMAWWEDWLEDYRDARLNDRHIPFDALAREYLAYMEKGTPGDAEDRGRQSWYVWTRRYESRIAPELAKLTVGELADGKLWKDFFHRMVA